MLNQKLVNKMMAKLPTGQMRRREVKKLLLRVVDSLFQVTSEMDSAWEGTLVDTGGRLALETTKDEILEIDAILPRGETGRLMLIWMKEDVKKPKKGI